MYYGSATSVAESLHGEDVVVVGGANSAGQAAVYLARFARRVTILVRAGSLVERMSSYLVEQVTSLANVEVRTRTRVIDAIGREHLERVRVTGLEGDRELPATAMFIVIGARPRSVRCAPARSNVASAVGEGSVAIQFAHVYQSG